jgi:23S rRNA (adenine2503-C2)-methyltransferase
MWSLKCLHHFTPATHDRPRLRKVDVEPALCGHRDCNSRFETLNSLNLVLQFDRQVYPVYRFSLCVLVTVHFMATLASAPAIRREVGSDGTVKLTFCAAHETAYEACLLNLPYRQVSRVICVSTQIGCPFDCTFCAVGDTPFLRNLSGAEILEQIIAVSRDPAWIDEDFEVAAMGTGEPLFALQELLQGIVEARSHLPRLCSLNISTVGLPAKIREYAQTKVCGVRLNLQISLHGTSDEQRGIVMPRATTAAGLKSVLEACEEFALLHRRHVVVNYLLLRGINDSIVDAQRLVSLLSPEYFTVKISALNPVSDGKVFGTDHTALQSFCSSLRALGLEARVFTSAGSDISAGCGQFSNNLSL